MRRLSRPWARLVAGAVLAIVLLATVSPQQPSARIQVVGGIAAGALTGLALYLIVMRRRPSAPRGASVSLALASCALLGFAAAGEEVVWRRVVLGELLRSGPILALAGSSLAFAFAHRTRPALHLGTGAVFGGVYLATGALVACIIAHWVYNVLLLSIAGSGRAGVRSLAVSFAELDRVSKSFGSKRALANVSFAVDEGEILALLGPNGAGKTTAIGILLGLRRADAGVARLFGGDPRRPASRRLLGVTPQDTAFPETLRVREIVELVRAHYDSPLPVAALSERFELDRLVGRQAGGLSGGERRRVGVALAFVGNPRLAVLDEPTTGLDIEARRSVWAAVRSHRANGGSVLLTTHHLAEAEALADRVVLVEGGKVVADGTVDEVKADGGMTLVRFRAAPGFEVAGAERDGEHLRILTSDPGATVDRLVRAGVRLAELEVRTLTLEEALEARGARP